MNFREILEAKTREAIQSSAYISGSDDYQQGLLYLNPFEQSSKAYSEYLDGYEDAKFLSNLERFHDRVAA
jgi:hypothetical protein